MIRPLAVRLMLVRVVARAAVAMGRAAATALSCPTMATTVERRPSIDFFSQTEDGALSCKWRELHPLDPKGAIFMYILYLIAKSFSS